MKQLLYKRPTLKELYQRIVSILTSRIEGDPTVLDRSNINASAAAQSSMANSLYGYIAHIYNQIWPDSCDEENVPKHAYSRGLQRKLASHTIGSVEFTGTAGEVIPENTIFQNDLGHEYVLDEEATIEGGTATGSVTALTAGAASNMPAGGVLNFVSPLASIDSTATVLAPGLSGGVDEEKIAEIQGRTVTRWHFPPQGGAGHDYDDWARQVPGVTRVWVSPKEMGSGTVTVRYVMDNEEDIFPTEIHAEIVHAFIEEKKPVCPEIFVVSPVPQAFDLEIQLSPSSEAIKQAIINELNALIRREGAPSKPLLISKIREAISIAAGEHDHVLVSPIANVVHTTGKMPVLGEITWGEIS